MNATPIKILTQERLKELLSYDPITGDFIRKIDNCRGGKKGEIVGHLCSEGYIRMRIGCKIYKAHRLVWLYMYGYFPEYEIDHILGIKSDNRLSELREVSRRCNMRNQKIRNTNTSGITGVSPAKGKWRSIIMVNSKSIHLGYFVSKLDAAEARWEGEKKYNFPNCNTTSSALKYIKENANDNK